MEIIENISYLIPPAVVCFRFIYKLINNYIHELFFSINLYYFITLMSLSTLISVQSPSNNSSQQATNNKRMASSDSWSPLKNFPTILMARTSFKVNEDHLLNLAIKARLENRECGYLSRRGGPDPSSSPHKWQLKWFVLYQNLLFYYDNVNSPKPQGVYFLESCYSSRSPAKNSKDGEKLVSLFII